MGVKFFYCLTAALVFAFSALAQDYSGQWEGELIPPAGGKQRLKVRMELVQQGQELIGLVYTRGYEKGVSYGCDFFVTGNADKKGFALRWKNIQRDFNTGNSCAMFRDIKLRGETIGGILLLTGQWSLMDDEAQLRISRTDSLISPIAEDEINQYLKQLYAVYDSLQVELEPAERLIETAINQSIKSKEVVLDFSAADSTGLDSIHVVLNGDLLVKAHDLSLRPLRIRMPVVDDSDIEFLIISLSRRHPAMNLRVQIRDGEEPMIIDVKPGRVRNTRLFFYLNRTP